MHTDFHLSVYGAIIHDEFMYNRKLTKVVSIDVIDNITQQYSCLASVIVLFGVYFDYSDTHSGLTNTLRLYYHISI